MADLARKLVFSAWADGGKRKGFDPVAAAMALTQLDEASIVWSNDLGTTAVEVLNVGGSGMPVQLRLLALHDADNAPSSWGPGAGATPVEFGTDRYAAFFTHVAIWEDLVVAHDSHQNAPGLGRLADYIRARVPDQRVVFRALYEQDLVEELKDLDRMRGLSYGIYDAHKVAKARAYKQGILSAVLPNQDAPSFSLTMGMSRKDKRDAYLPDEVSNAILSSADAADELFDKLIIRGPSKTRKTAAGNPETLEINLLSKRLHVAVELPRDPNNGGAVEPVATFNALSNARAALQADEKIERAVEARLLADAA